VGHAGQEAYPGVFRARGAALTQMALLSFAHVGKSYSHVRGDVVVLENVSFEVDAGDCVGIWGMRRAGKSTLLRVAAGIELPDTGDVCFDGRGMGEMGAGLRARLLRGAIGLASTELQAARNERVVDHVSLPLMSSGVSFRHASVAGRRVLHRVGAADCADVCMSYLSPGEQIRVALARALVHEPRLLLVDEPATTPSPVERDELHGLLRSLAREEGMTLVVASEDTRALRGMGRMMAISDGRLRTTDRPGMVVPLRARGVGAGAARVEQPGS
jgi:predicted ABC-type transport system involved in lysophospholipase L1 biosynthesis ATPase subunit